MEITVYVYQKGKLLHTIKNSHYFAGVFGIDLGYKSIPMTRSRIDFEQVFNDKKLRYDNNLSHYNVFFD